MKIFKKGHKLSGEKIKMTPEIKKQIDDVIKKQEEIFSRQNCRWDVCPNPRLCRNDCIRQIM